MDLNANPIPMVTSLELDMLGGLVRYIPAYVATVRSNYRTKTSIQLILYNYLATGRYPHSNTGIKIIQNFMKVMECIEGRGSNAETS